MTWLTSLLLKPKLKLGTGSGTPAQSQLLSNDRRLGRERRGGERRAQQNPFGTVTLVSV